VDRTTYSGPNLSKEPETELEYRRGGIRISGSGNRPKTRYSTQDWKDNGQDSVHTTRIQLEHRRGTGGGGIEDRAGIFKESMGARHRGGIGLSYRPARLRRLAEFIPWNRFLGSINV